MIESNSEFDIIEKIRNQIKVISEEFLENIEYFERAFKIFQEKNSLLNIRY